MALRCRCGEDERPLNELLVLQIDSQTCNQAFGSVSKEEAKISNNLVHKLLRFIDSAYHKCLTRYA